LVRSVQSCTTVSANTVTRVRSSATRRFYRRCPTRPIAAQSPWPARTVLVTRRVRAGVDPGARLSMHASTTVIGTRKCAWIRNPLYSPESAGPSSSSFVDRLSTQSAITSFFLAMNCGAACLHRRTVRPSSNFRPETNEYFFLSAIRPNNPLSERTNLLPVREVDDCGGVGRAISDPHDESDHPAIRKKGDSDLDSAD